MTQTVGDISSNDASCSGLREHSLSATPSTAVAVERELDVIILGATGYTGRLCAEYIVKKLQTPVKWAIAGRSKDKLSALADNLNKDEHCNSQLVEVITLDVSSEVEVVNLVRRTKVLISVVGPYAKWGCIPFKACAENGTHYLDCNGETPWLKEMIERYHVTAQSSHAIMIPSCGIGVVPADLTTKILTTHIRRTFHAPTAEVLTAIHDVRARPSGGTINSVCHTLSAGLPTLLAAYAPFALSPHKPAPAPSAAHTPKLPSLNAFGVQTVLELGTLIVSPQDDHDRAVVHRSWGLHGPEGYGARFSFVARMRMPGPVSGWWWRACYVAEVVALMVPAVRWVVGRWVYPSGSGPSAAQREKNFFEYRTLGVADTAAEGEVEGEGEGEEMKKALVEMGDAGDAYEFTGLALVEAAVVLMAGGTEAHERGGGVLTPAMLGEVFADRLIAAGVRIEVKNL